MNGRAKIRALLRLSFPLSAAAFFPTPIHEIRKRRKQKKRGNWLHILHHHHLRRRRNKKFFMLRVGILAAEWSKTSGRHYRLSQPGKTIKINGTWKWLFRLIVKYNKQTYGRGFSLFLSLSCVSPVFGEEGNPIYRLLRRKPLSESREKRGIEEKSESRLVREKKAKKKKLTPVIS